MSNRHARFVALLVAVLIGAGLTPALGAAPPTEDPPTAAGLAAAWLAGHIGPDGTVEGSFDPLGDAGTAALALAAAGVGEEAFGRVVDNIVADPEPFVAPFGTDDPGRLGRLLQLAAVAGIDPTDIGGVDAVARLDATLGAAEPGLYGAGDPTYDGTFRQSLAILGLHAVGAPVPLAATDWLRDQQCSGADPLVDGAWTAYRADTGVPCPAPDATTFTGPDSNSTALALSALTAAGITPDHDVEPWLRATEEADGGWAFVVGAGTDPNSTALVVRALAAAGLDAATFGEPGARPLDALLSWLVPCGAADEGAFASPFSGGAGDVFATLDAIPAAAGLGLPLTAPVTFGAAPTSACPLVTTTTTTTPSTTATTAPDPAGPAVPVPAAPTFAG